MRAAAGWWTGPKRPFFGPIRAEERGNQPTIWAADGAATGGESRPQARRGDSERYRRVLAVRQAASAGIGGASYST